MQNDHSSFLILGQNQAMQPTGIRGGGIGPDNKVGRAAYPGRLIAIVGRGRCVSGPDHGEA